MFLKVQLPWNVLVPAENLGPMLQRSIVHHLLDDFAQRKAAKDVGYFVVVTSVDSIGDGRVKQGTGEVEFPVLFSGITFKLFKGEVLLGVVQEVLRYGVFLQCGPAETVFISNKKMPDYRYVLGDNPMFLNDKLSSKIERDMVVHFVVIGTQWLPEKREFRAVVGLDADYLGPVS
ncbi:DNA-directed RNA polymerase V subunit 7 isoform X1 [Prunus yedoensis var. nudiflora]|uniref:DNA-directed RNA polymerase subunit n=1 Tax=Prunus yedoensis var. nudiflora TaxID=2094558 RepID=A0A314XJK9_PRUYE|nr:DNA-directed RNA polymerase V subunit 7 isoform X1 [Prunus yedoensis var. nudiflora]